MGVLIGASQVTRFSYIEYQALMLCLAGLMVISLVAVEIALARFQVLPLLFPGMFTVRERRFYCFSFDISDGALGKRIRGEAKMLIRMTLCIVLSYLWQHCVLKTSQHVGTEFPIKQCLEEHDCFASELHFLTLFNRQHTAIDCSGSDEDFDSQVVVSCIRFVDPVASTWLMHLAIAHSVTQLNFKAYEVLVWITGNSPRVRKSMAVMIFGTIIVFLTLFFAGVLSEFVSSWLSFVMSLSVPIFLYTVWKSGHALENLWKLEAQKVQLSIEEHFNSAFADIEAEVAASVEYAGGDISRPGDEEGPRTAWSRFAKTTKTTIQNAMKFPNMLSTRRPTGNSRCSTDSEGEPCLDESGIAAERRSNGSAPSSVQAFNSEPMPAQSFTPPSTSLTARERPVPPPLTTVLDPAKDDGPELAGRLNKDKGSL